MLRQTMGDTHAASVRPFLTHAVRLVGTDPFQPATYFPSGVRPETTAIIIDPDVCFEAVSGPVLAWLDLPGSTPCPGVFIWWVGKSIPSASATVTN